jgi:hypothetical protein
MIINQGYHQGTVPGIIILGIIKGMIALSAITNGIGIEKREATKRRGAF